ncbi:MAG TPA: EXLDI protein [Thermomicrobiaceae bacterium]|nr:EXLDI protein [Thermomicrobiaceae bacterium]
MPNKTIYVSDDDLPLFQRAQELAAGSLSSAISAALRRYVEVEEGRHAGYDEVTVEVGSGARRKVRFTGALLGQWRHSSGVRIEEYRVYRTRKGNFVVYLEHAPDWTWSGGWGKKPPPGWLKYLGLGNPEEDWGFARAESTLEVADSLEALRAKIPAELYDMVVAVADEPPVQDLDV